MTAIELINEDIPPLKIEDTALKALAWMHEFHVSNLAVVKGKEFIGMISEDELYDLDEPDAPIGSHRLTLIKPVLHSGQHVYDALRLMAELSLDVIAVTDENGKFLGSVTLPRLAEKLSRLAAVRSPGGILVLEVNNVDYSLSQISQIVEGNDAKILSCYVGSVPDSNKVEVTLKVNKDDLSRILQTFARYNYVVKATYHQSSYEEDMQQRYEEFMNYINM
ncbi:MAG TPA: CBS domain-containing protein [Bacteroidia bacterium]|nr:CBS domain-containing protein [Bacteroidia bacterium]